MPLAGALRDPVGWPTFVQAIAAAYRELSPAAVIVGSSYGESGAVDRFGPDHNLRVPRVPKASC